MRVTATATQWWALSPGIALMMKSALIHDQFEQPTRQLHHVDGDQTKKSRWSLAAQAS